MAAHRRNKHRRLNPRFLAMCVLLLTVITSVTGVIRYRQAHQGLPGAEVDLPEYVIKDHLTVNPFSRPGTPLKKINGIVIHYVGNPNTTAEANRNYFDSLQDGKEGVYASAHFIVGLSGEVVQCIPLTEISYASNSRNSDTIGIENCHPDETGKFSEVTYDRLVKFTAYLCKQFDLTEKDVIRHYDVSGKICPKYYVEHEDAWKQFLADVKTELESKIETNSK